MRGLMEWIRSALCRHEWEPYQLGGFLVVDGWLRRVTVCRCRKCGRMKDIT